MDPRVVRTLADLRAALLAECATRPFEDVTVSDIVRRAQIGRTTFYLHYDDLGALAVDACAAVVREAVEALHAWDPLPDPAHPPSELVGLLTSVADSADLYRSLLAPGGGGPLGGLLHRELAARSRAERARRLSHGPHDLISSAVAGAFTGMLADWVHGIVSGTPEEVADRLWPLLCTMHSVGR